MEEYMQYIPEIIVGLVLGGFAWAFKSWSQTLAESSEKILNRLDRLATEFHDHELKVESRVSKLEKGQEVIQDHLSNCTLSKKLNQKP